MVNFARELVLKGYYVLRFDFMGHGDSEGDFENSTVKSRLSDVESAVHFLKKNYLNINRIAFLGLRFGATLAFISANNQQIAEFQRRVGRI